ncbi:hypothetical protein [Microbulbifer sp. PAAF003]|uniref:hypothetical protein n=1 Tax=unclassified Microbulbifer TaxID=2619833 RepID=UPI00403964FD
MTGSDRFSSIKTLSGKSELIEYHRQFSHGEYKQLQQGLTARSMDEKWNGYFHDGRFYLCRSWTGVCIYELDLVETESGCSAENTRVNRDPSQYRETDNRYDVLLLDFLISNLILGEPKPFPRRSTDDVPGEVEQYSVAGVRVTGGDIGKKL